MKKVTILTPPEYEGLVLESLGQAQVTQLKHVTDSEFEGIEESSEQSVDYRALYQRVQTHLVEPLGLDINEVTPVTPSTTALREFARDPAGKVDTLIKQAESLLKKVESTKESIHAQNNKLISELQEKLEVDEKDFNDAKSKLMEQLQEIDAEKVTLYQERLKLKAKLDSISALEPDELKNCFAVGVVNKGFITQMNEYLKRYPNTYSKVSDLSKDEALLFVFGDDESKKWIDALFLVYDIKDIFDVLDPADVLLVLDPLRRQGVIKKYKEKLAELEKNKVTPEDETPEERELSKKIKALEVEHDKKVADLKEEYNGKIKANEKLIAEKLEEFQQEQKDFYSLIGYFTKTLRIYSRKNAPVLRGKIISVLQGYTPDTMTGDLRKAIEKVEGEIGERLYVEVTDLGEDDHNAPTPEIDFKSNKLQPLWILTRLRGWPSAEELNPGYISVLIFSFQFGLMFGDIGQGLIFLVIGLLLSGKYKRGMLKYLASLFVPLGLAAVIFGFMYDSIFLNEHLISHWLHEAHIELPFHYPIMPNPIHETASLLNLIFMVGAIEVVFGSILGAFNSFKKGDYVAIIGEHGLGMGMYVLGLYLSAGNMFTEGLDVVGMLGNWTFKIALLGLGMSTIEPILHSLQHGHGVGIEALGEAVGGFLMTFVEGLANMFSFLRLAAFALAHASLAGAALSMGDAIGSTIGALVMMNIIALSFEFVSSSVQSLRLLYYEFMGKFFHGEGIPFRPFRVSAPKTVVE